MPGNDSNEIDEDASPKKSKSKSKKKAKALPSNVIFEESKDSINN